VSSGLFEHRNIRCRLLWGSFVIAAAGVAALKHESGSVGILVGFLGAALERVVALTEHVVGHDLHQSLSESSMRPDEVIKNHDLTAAAATAVKLSCSLVAQGDAQLSPAERRTVERIGHYSATGLPTILNESPLVFQAFAESEITGLLTSWTDPSRTIPLLSEQGWQLLLTALATHAGILVVDHFRPGLLRRALDGLRLTGRQYISPLVIKRVAGRIDVIYQRALREVLKEDFRSGGRAFAGLQLLVWAELLSLCRDMTEQLSAWTERSQQILETVDRQHRDLSEVVKTNQIIARQEITSLIERVDRATWRRDAEILHRLTALDAELTPLIQRALPTLDEILAAVRKRDPVSDWHRYAKSVITRSTERNSNYAYALPRKPITIRCQVDESYSDVLTDAIITLASEPNSKPGIVFGEYGQGKTVACGVLASQLATSFLADPTRGRLPIIIQLRDIASVENLSESILSTFGNTYGSVLDRVAFKQAQQEGRLFFILDGVDELIARSEAQDVEYHLDHITANDLFRKNKLVITTRPNVINSSIYSALLKPYFHIFKIEFLTLHDVRTYLKAHGLDKLLMQMSAGAEKLLTDLLKRPLFLDMIRQMGDVPKGLRSFSELTQSELFERYVKRWFDRESAALGGRLGGLSFAEVETVLSSAANEMNQRRTDSIADLDLDRLLEGRLKPCSRVEIARLRAESRQRLVLVPDFGMEGRLTFRHPSLQSYFAARHLCNELGRRSANNVDEIGELKKARVDDVTLGFLIDLARRHAEVGNRLRDLQTSFLEPTDFPVDTLGAVLLIWALRTGGRLPGAFLRTFCAKATGDTRDVALQSLEGVDLSGMDLSGLDLHRANLRAARLVRTNLSGSGLQEATLDGAVMTGATLAGADVSSAFFRRADLTGADLSGLSGTSASFEGATLIGALLESTHLKDTNFTSATVNSANLSTAEFEHCLFVGTQLHDANIFKAVWSSCNMAGAELFGTRTVDSIFIDTNISEALCDPDG
jgi:uncharacterized protein YjbI with pentapeptide repeats